MDSADERAFRNLHYDKPIDCVPSARHVLFSSTPSMPVTPSDDGRPWRPIHLGVDLAKGEDKACIVVLEDGCVIRRAAWIDEAGVIDDAVFDLVDATQASLNRFADNVASVALAGMNAGLESAVREMVVKPLLRAVAPTPLPVLGRMIRTDNASYPAWVLH